MPISVKTNKTKGNGGYRMPVMIKEIREYVLPRFHYMKDRSFKIVKWHNHNGLELWYKKFDDVVKVAFAETGGGYPDTFYSEVELIKMINDQKNDLLRKKQGEVRGIQESKESPANV